MPATSPAVGATAQRTLRALGGRIRARRKQLGLTALATAEAAGMSRVTLHRIEKGEPSVTMGAYASAAEALGLELGLRDPAEEKRRARTARSALPASIRVSSYPQLKKLAWQLRGDQSLSPEEALNLYERNWRHVDLKALQPRERSLLEALLEAFGRERLLV